MFNYTGRGALNARGVQTVSWGQSIEVKEGDVYSLLARVRSVMSVKPPSFDMALVPNTGDTVWSLKGSVVDSVEWVALQVDVTIPAGVTSVTLTLRQTEPTASFEIDEFQAGDVTLVREMGAQVSAAASSASSASTSATSAEQSAKAAASSATTAKTKASEASTSASEASTAKDSAQTAQAEASKSSTTAATSAKESANSATAASSSASAAKTSATSAATSASTATEQANTAKTKASEASTSASEASAAKDSAQTAQAEASKSSTTAATSAKESASSASAASSSATAAKTSATNAATSASTATEQANTAKTKAGEASTSAANAATSETNASKSASEAATSSSTAASAKGEAIRAASDALPSTFERDGLFWTQALIGTAEARQSGSLHSAVQFSTEADVGRVAYVTSPTSTNIHFIHKSYLRGTADRTYRVTAVAKMVGSLGENIKSMAYLQLRSVSADGKTGTILSSRSVKFSALDTWETFTLELKYTGSDPNLLGFLYINNAEFIADGVERTLKVKEVRFVDVTSEMAAKDSASAASTSATQASASATAASQSASSASTQASTAATQAGLAQTSATNAATSETNAASSAQSASNSVSLAALSLSNGMSKNPVFLNWSGARPDGLSVYQGSSDDLATKVTGKYGNAYQFETKQIDKVGPYLTVWNTAHTGGNDPRRVLITAEVEVLSGDPTGVMVDAAWTFAGTRSWKTKKFGPNLKAGIVTYQVVLDRPTSTEVSTDFIFRFHSSYTADGGTRSIIKLNLHRFDCQEVLADSYIDQQLQTKATLDGLTSSTYTMRLKSGGATAGLEMVAASDLNGSSAKIRMSADEILMDGTVSTPSLKAGAVTASKVAIGDSTNLYPDYDCADKDFYTSSGPALTFSTTTSDYAGGSEIKMAADGEVYTNWCSSDGATDLRFTGALRTSDVVGLTATLYVELGTYNASSKTFSKIREVSIGSVTRDYTFKPYSANISVTDKEDRFRFKMVRSGGATTGNACLAGLIVRQRTNGTLLVNGTITAEHLSAEKVITGSAQIGNAIITSAHISEVSADKIKAGTAIASSVTVDGTALSTLNDPAVNINKAKTQIDPGKIVISGDTSLSDWRGTDKTTINGGAIQSNSITSQSLKVADAYNLIEDSSFKQGGTTGWTTTGSDELASYTIKSRWYEKATGAPTWSQPAVNAIACYISNLPSKETTEGWIQFQYMGQKGKIEVRPSQYYQISGDVSIHRGKTLLVGAIWYMADGTRISETWGKETTALMGASSSPLTWGQGFALLQAPASSQYMVPVFRSTTLNPNPDANATSTTTSTYIYLANPMVCRSQAGATEAPYVESTTTTINGGNIATETVTANQLVKTEAIITNSAQIKSAIITEAHVTGTLSAAKLRAGTALASTLTVDGTALSTLNDPAVNINKGKTQIDPGKILISGSTSLASWSKGGDETRIDGGALANDSVTTNKLTVGNRGLTITGLQFETNDPSIDFVSWTQGSIVWTKDDGTQTETVISKGGAEWTSNILYIIWKKAQTVLTTTTDRLTAQGVDNVIIATYEGDTYLNTNYGRTVIDGGSIKTGTINASDIQAGKMNARYLEVTERVDLQDTASLSYGKTDIDDTTDGIFFGRSSVQNDARFGFAVSRTQGDRKQSVVFSKDLFQITNARFNITNDVTTTQLSFTATTGVIALPAGVKRVSIQGIGGGASGTYNGSFNPGGDTIVRLYDGSTKKYEVTFGGAKGQAPSGNKGVGNSSYYAAGGGVSGMVGYDAGGYGAGGGGAVKSYSTTTTDTGHDGGNSVTEYHYAYQPGGGAATRGSTGDVDVSGYASVSYEVIVGAAGAGISGKVSGQRTNSGSGGTGVVYIQYNGAIVTPADVIPLYPTTSGTLNPSTNTDFTFPELGPGMWVVSTGENRSLSLDKIEIHPDVYLWVGGNQQGTFISSLKAPRARKGTNAGKIYFHHYAMGSWG
jgi:ribosome-associated protein YbcJ (S4-like RNA binding protein)